MKRLMETLKVPEDQPLENKMVTRALEGAQERVEGYYFDQRKQVLAYDDVLNRQRNAMYGLRRGVMLEGKWVEPEHEPEDLDQRVAALIAEQAHEFTSAHTGEGEPDHWNINEIAEVINSLTGQATSDLRTLLEQARDEALADGPEAAREKLQAVVDQQLQGRLAARREELGEESLQRLERAATIRAIDTHWMEHLDTMDYLRTGIGLRGYGQRDPLVEYQREGLRLFQQLVATIKGSIVEVVFRAETVRSEPAQGEARHASATAPHRIAEQVGKPAPDGGAGAPVSSRTTTSSDGPLQNPHKDTGRNDPCWCGSGLKYKRCGLINAPEHQG